MTTAVKITFNLPAQQYFFEGGEICGARVRIEDGQLFFRPVSNVKTEEYILLKKRTRGGLESLITGDVALTILSVLQDNKVSVAMPFFTLHKSDRGWATVTHYGGIGSPPKFAPHMRVWLASKDNKKPVVPPMNDEITHLLGSFVSVVRVAKQVLNDYDNSDKIGRPSKEVIESKAIIKAFEELAKEIVTHNTDVPDIEPLYTAAEILTSFINRGKNLKNEKPI